MGQASLPAAGTEAHAANVGSIGVSPVRLLCRAVAAAYYTTAMRKLQILSVVATVIGLSLTGCRTDAPAQPKTESRSADAAPTAPSHPSSAAPAPRATPEHPAPAHAGRVLAERWPDGRPKLRYQLTRLPDGTEVKSGPEVAWFANGNVQFEGTYVNGLLEGVTTEYHESGQKWVETHFVHGLKDGPCLTWNTKGVLVREEHYAADKPVGTWKTWDQGGELESVQVRDTPETPTP